MQKYHPRRPPAHLSVSLRHDAAGSDSTRAQGRQHHSQSTRSVQRQSDEGDESVDSSHAWFDRVNKHPSMQSMVDNDPPFFLRQPSSKGSNVGEHIQGLARVRQRELPYHPLPGPYLHAHTNGGSSADDFRSVIDDLTIENKKLKEKLRKYKNDKNSHLAKDKLFELKIHRGLSSRKKRELEETLRSFASSMEGSAGAPSPNNRLGDARLSSSTVPANDSSSSATPNSRPVDSAYASMSTSGPNSSSTLDRGAATTTTTNKNGRTPSAKSKKQEVQSFLQDIPEGLFPRHNPVLTEKAKKRLVVRRLEELFTGKTRLGNLSDSQPQQQQEVSYAAQASGRDFLNQGKHVLEEGVREAHILESEMDIERNPATLSKDNSSGHSEPDNREFTAATVQTPGSPEQRPTRPLDLDPDRAQIPAENMKYIRHLGLSTPNMKLQEIEDAAPDANGWVYLNLLVNMAQLHIINVTPDFVRSAIGSLSTKFQLSPDGTKIRWRGGTDGTLLSSDSSADSGVRESPDDSDSIEETKNKRRKLDPNPRLRHAWDFTVKSGHFSSIPIHMPAHRENTGDEGVAKSSQFQYQPLFQHRLSSEESASTDPEGSVSRRWRAPRESSRRGNPGIVSKDRAESVSSASQKRDKGTIVFYSGAPFCTDLTGDRGDIMTPNHVSDVGKDGFSNHVSPLGSSVNMDIQAGLWRTPSGTSLNYRPFKDYSRLDPLELENQRPKTPDLITDDDSSPDFDFSPSWSEANTSYTEVPLPFEVSGLGGIQPADHFLLRVQTARARLGGRYKPQVSRFSAAGPHTKRFLHKISKSSLDAFRASDKSKDLSERLAHLRAASPPEAFRTKTPVDLPIRSTVLSTTTAILTPSSLPEPSYFMPPSDSGESSMESSSDEGIDFLRRHRPFFQADNGDGSNANQASLNQSVIRSRRGDDSIVGEDDDDSSIDMLAHARLQNPDMVALQEREFDYESAQRQEEDRRLGSSAATVAGESDLESDTTQETSDDYSGSEAMSDEEMEDE